MIKYIEPHDFIEITSVNELPDNIDALIIKASLYIEKMTSGRIENITDNVKVCTCEIIKILIEKEKMTFTNIQSENVDGWSRTYKNSQETTIDFEIEMIETLKFYLMNEKDANGKPLNLLYRGK